MGHLCNVEEDFLFEGSLTNLAAVWNSYHTEGYEVVIATLQRVPTVPIGWTLATLQKVSSASIGWIIATLHKGTKCFYWLDP